MNMFNGYNQPSYESEQSRVNALKKPAWPYGDQYYNPDVSQQQPAANSWAAPKPPYIGVGAKCACTECQQGSWYHKDQNEVITTPNGQEIMLLGQNGGSCGYPAELPYVNQETYARPGPSMPVAKPFQPCSYSNPVNQGYPPKAPAVKLPAKTEFTHLDRSSDQYMRMLEASTYARKQPEQRQNYWDGTNGPFFQNEMSRMQQYQYQQSCRYPPYNPPYYFQGSSSVQSYQHPQQNGVYPYYNKLQSQPRQVDPLPQHAPSYLKPDNNPGSKISPLRLMRKKKLVGHIGKGSPPHSPHPPSGNAPKLDVRRFLATWAEDEEAPPTPQMVVLDCQDINPEQAELLRWYEENAVRIVPESLSATQVQQPPLPQQSQPPISQHSRLPASHQSQPPISQHSRLPTSHQPQPPTSQHARLPTTFQPQFPTPYPARLPSPHQPQLPPPPNKPQLPAPNQPQFPAPNQPQLPAPPLPQLPASNQPQLPASHQPQLPALHQPQLPTPHQVLQVELPHWQNQSQLPPHHHPQQLQPQQQSQRLPLTLPEVPPSVVEKPVTDEVKAPEIIQKPEEPPPPPVPPDLIPSEKESLENINPSVEPIEILQESEIIESSSCSGSPSDSSDSLPLLADLPTSEYRKNKFLDYDQPCFPKLPTTNEVIVPNSIAQNVVPCREVATVDGSEEHKPKKKRNRKPTIKFSIQKSHDLKISLRVMNESERSKQQQEEEQFEETLPGEPDSSGRELITFSVEGMQDKEMMQEDSLGGIAKKSRKVKRRFYQSQSYSVSTKDRPCGDASDGFQVQESVDSAKIKLTFKRRRSEAISESRKRRLGDGVVTKKKKKKKLKATASDSGCADSSDGDVLSADTTTDYNGLPPAIYPALRDLNRSPHELQALAKVALSSGKVNENNSSGSPILTELVMPALLKDCAPDRDCQLSDEKVSSVRSHSEIRKDHSMEAESIVSDGFDLARKESSAIALTSSRNSPNVTGLVSVSSPRTSTDSIERELQAIWNGNIGDSEDTDAYITHSSTTEKEITTPENIPRESCTDNLISDSDNIARDTHVIVDPSFVSESHPPSISSVIDNSFSTRCGVINFCRSRSVVAYTDADEKPLDLRSSFHSDRSERNSVSAECTVYADSSEGAEHSHQTGFCLPSDNDPFIVPEGPLQTQSTSPASDLNNASLGNAVTPVNTFSEIVEPSTADVKAIGVANSQEFVCQSEVNEILTDTVTSVASIDTASEPLASRHKHSSPVQVPSFEAVLQLDDGEHQSMSEEHHPRLNRMPNEKRRAQDFDPVLTMDSEQLVQNKPLTLVIETDIKNLRSVGKSVCENDDYNKDQLLETPTADEVKVPLSPSPKDHVCRRIQTFDISEKNCSGGVGEIVGQNEVEVRSKNSISDWSLLAFSKKDGRNRDCEHTESEIKGAIEPHSTQIASPLRHDYILNNDDGDQSNCSVIEPKTATDHDCCSSHLAENSSSSASSGAESPCSVGSSGTSKDGNNSPGCTSSIDQSPNPKIPLDTSFNKVEFHNQEVDVTCPSFTTGFGNTVDSQNLEKRVCSDTSYMLISTEKRAEVSKRQKSLVDYSSPPTQYLAPFPSNNEDDNETHHSVKKVKKNDCLSPRSNKSEQHAVFPQINDEQVGKFVSVFPCDDSKETEQISCGPVTSFGEMKNNSQPLENDTSSTTYSEKIPHMTDEPATPRSESPANDDLPVSPPQSAIDSGVSSHIPRGPRTPKSASPAKSDRNLSPSPCAFYAEESSHMPCGPRAPPNESPTEYKVSENGFKENESEIVGYPGWNAEMSPYIPRGHTTPTGQSSSKTEYEPEHTNNDLGECQGTAKEFSNYSWLPPSCNRNLEVAAHVPRGPRTPKGPAPDSPSYLCSPASDYLSEFSYCRDEGNKFENRDCPPWTPYSNHVGTNSVFKNVKCLSPVKTPPGCHYGEESSDHTVVSPPVSPRAEQPKTLYSPHKSPEGLNDIHDHCETFEESPPNRPNEVINDAIDDDSMMSIELGSDENANIIVTGPITPDEVNNIVLEDGSSEFILEELIERPSVAINKNAETTEVTQELVQTELSEIPDKADGDDIFETVEVVDAKALESCSLVCLANESEPLSEFSDQRDIDYKNSEDIEKIVDHSICKPRIVTEDAFTNENNANSTYLEDWEELEVLEEGEIVDDEDENERYIMVNECNNLNMAKETDVIIVEPYDEDPPKICVANINPALNIADIPLVIEPCDEYPSKTCIENVIPALDVADIPLPPGKAPKENCFYLKKLREELENKMVPASVPKRPPSCDSPFLIGNMTHFRNPSPPRNDERPGTPGVFTMDDEIQIVGGDLILNESFSEELEMQSHQRSSKRQTDELPAAEAIVDGDQVPNDDEFHDVMASCLERTKRFLDMGATPFQSTANVCFSPSELKIDVNASASASSETLPASERLLEAGPKKSADRGKDVIVHSSEMLTELSGKCSLNNTPSSMEFPNIQAFAVDSHENVEDVVLSTSSVPKSMELNEDLSASNIPCSEGLRENGPVPPKSLGNSKNNVRSASEFQSDAEFSQDSSLSHVPSSEFQNSAAASAENHESSKDVLLSSSGIQSDLESSGETSSSNVSLDCPPSSSVWAPEVLPVDNWPYLEEEVPLSPSWKSPDEVAPEDVPTEAELHISNELAVEENPLLPRFLCTDKSHEALQELLKMRKKREGDSQKKRRSTVDDISSDRLIKRSSKLSLTDNESSSSEIQPEFLKGNLKCRVSLQRLNLSEESLVGKCPLLDQLVSPEINASSETYKSSKWQPKVVLNTIHLPLPLTDLPSVVKARPVEKGHKLQVSVNASAKIQSLSVLPDECHIIGPQSRKKSRRLSFILKNCKYEKRHRDDSCSSNGSSSSDIYHTSTLNPIGQKCSSDAEGCDYPKAKNSPISSLCEANADLAQVNYEVETPGAASELVSISKEPLEEIIDCKSVEETHKSEIIICHSKPTPTRKSSKKPRPDVISENRGTEPARTKESAEPKGNKGKSKEPREVGICLTIQSSQQVKGPDKKARRNCELRSDKQNAAVNIFNSEIGKKEEEKLCETHKKNAEIKRKQDSNAERAKKDNSAAPIRGKKADCKKGCKKNDGIMYVKGSEARERLNEKLDATIDTLENNNTKSKACTREEKVHKGRKDRKSSSENNGFQRKDKDKLNAASKKPEIDARSENDVKQSRASDEIDIMSKTNETTHKKREQELISSSNVIETYEIIASSVDIKVEESTTKKANEREKITEKLGQTNERVDDALGSENNEDDVLSNLFVVRAKRAESKSGEGSGNNNHHEKAENGQTSENKPLISEKPAAKKPLTPKNRISVVEYTRRLKKDRQVDRVVHDATAEAVTINISDEESGIDSNKSVENKLVSGANLKPKEAEVRVGDLSNNEASQLAAERVEVPKTIEGDITLIDVKENKIVQIDLTSGDEMDKATGQKDVVNDGQRWVCGVCGFRDESLREKHIQEHSFHCQSCHLAFLSEPHFIEHLNLSHEDIMKQHHCLLCEVSFTSDVDYREHLKSREHQHLEAVEKNTIQTLFNLLAGRECPVLGPAVPRPEWLPSQAGTVHFYHQATPLSLAVQYWKLKNEKPTVKP